MAVEDRVAMSVRLPKDLHTRLRQHAAREHRSINAHLIYLLEQLDLTDEVDHERAA